MERTESDAVSVTSCSSTSSFPEDAIAAKSDGAPTTNGTATPGWSSNALEAMKDRATIAKNHFTPQLLTMREKTSKRMEKYQPSIDKVKSSVSATAVAGRERMTPALNRVKEGSTQGWSLLKTKLAAAAPVAERMQTLGLNVVTDLWHGDVSVELLRIVDHPAKQSSRFLDEYLTNNKTTTTPLAGGMLRLTRTASNTSNSVDTTASFGAQCFANRFVLGHVLLFCGDVCVLARVARVNRAARQFVATEKRLWRFCVRFGTIAPHMRAGFWEHAASVDAVRHASELDFDTYLHMALSKGESTELIRTDVRRTYGRVAPHKQSHHSSDTAAVPETDQALIQQLSDVLHALAGRFPDVGYCQGMDYIAAHVLDTVKQSRIATETSASDSCDSQAAATSATHSDVERAFWLLVALFERYGLREMFAPGLDQLQMHCFQLQQLFVLAAPALATHFERERVVAEMFTVGWFQTLFLYLNVLPRATLDAIWDVLLFERSWKIVLRAAVAILQIAEPFVLDRPIDDVMMFLNTFHDDANRLLARPALLERALSVKATNRVLTKFTRQYARRKRMTPERK